MENAILKIGDADKFGGQYVALSSLEEGEVVAGGKDPEAVLSEAAVKGFQSPLLVFVPEKDKVYIY